MQSKVTIKHTHKEICTVMTNLQNLSYLLKVPKISSFYSFILMKLRGLLDLARSSSISRELKAQKVKSINFRQHNLHRSNIQTATASVVQCFLVCSRLGDHSTKNFTGAKI